MIFHSSIPAGMIALVCAVGAGEATRRSAARMGASADRARLAGTLAHGLTTLGAGLSVNVVLADVAGPLTTGVQTAVSTYLYDYAVSQIVGY